MGQMIRQISPNTTRYYWYPGDRKEWLRALVATAAGGIVLGVTYLLTRNLLVALVLGLTVTCGLAGFNLGRRDLHAADGLTGPVTRRDAVAASGRAVWRGLVQGVLPAFAAVAIVHLPARGVLADWLLPLLPGVAAALARQGALLSARLGHESAPASSYTAAPTRRPHSTDAVGEPGAAV